MQQSIPIKSDIQKMNETIAIFMGWATNYESTHFNWHNLMLTWGKLRNDLLASPNKELFENDIMDIIEHICKVDIKAAHQKIYETIVKYQS